MRYLSWHQASPTVKWSMGRLKPNIQPICDHHGELYDGLEALGRFRCVYSVEFTTPSKCSNADHYAHFYESSLILNKELQELIKPGSSPPLQATNFSIKTRKNFESVLFFLFFHLFQLKLVHHNVSQ